MADGALLHAELTAFLPFLRCPTCRESAIGAEGLVLECRACGSAFEPSRGIPTCCDAETRKLGFLTDLDVVDVDARDAGEVVKANAVYHNNAAGSYNEDNVAVRSITEAGDGRLRELMEWMKMEGASGPFLDFGTGTGHVLGLAKGIFTPRLGLDISGGMLTRASQDGKPVLLADCTDPPVADRSVGVAVSYSFLHHFKEPAEILDQMLRVVRPGGWLMVDWEPNTHARPRFLANFVSWLIHPELWFKSLPHQRSEKIATVNALAEYHEVLGSGLDAEALAARLTALGCDRVQIVYHSNTPSALKPSIPFRARVRALLDGRWPSARATGVHFLLLARRGASA